MARFHIQVPHENAKKACEMVVSAFRTTGSHFLTHADFGCHDGVHMAWLHVEAESKEDARRIVPPPFREAAEVVEVEQLALEDMDRHKEAHKD